MKPLQKCPIIVSPLFAQFKTDESECASMNSYTNIQHIELNLMVICTRSY